MNSPQEMITFNPYSLLFGHDRCVAHACTHVEGELANVVLAKNNFLQCMPFSRLEGGEEMNRGRREGGQFCLFLAPVVAL